MMPPDPAPSDFAAAFNALQRDLACPACHSALHLASDVLICAQCQRRYPIVEGIPVLIAGAAQHSTEA